MPSNHLILCCPLPIFSSVRVSSNESVLCIRWPKYWNFSFSISPSNEYSGQGLTRVFSTTTVQKHQFSGLSFLCSPTLTSIYDYWKNHSLDRWTIVGKVMSLLLNMLSRLVITFLPRSKCLLISWLQPPSAVILEPPSQINSFQTSFVIC